MLTRTADLQRRLGTIGFWDTGSQRSGLPLQRPKGGWVPLRLLRGGPGQGFLQGMGRLSILMRDAGSVMPRRGNVAAWLLAVL